jgi:hypothetical protein
MWGLQEKHTSQILKTVMKSDLQRPHHFNLIISQATEINSIQLLL